MVRDNWGMRGVGGRVGAVSGRTAAFFAALCVEGHARFEEYPDELRVPRLAAPARAVDRGEAVRVHLVRLDALRQQDLSDLVPALPIEHRIPGEPH